MKHKGLITIIVVFIFGIALGYFIPGHYLKSVPIESKKERKIKYWVAPMDPSYRRDKPGKSPMGMDLIPVYEDEKPTTDQQSIKISPRVVDNLGVVTAKVRKQSLSQSINTVGYVVVNEDNIENVHSYIDGWIRNLQVTAAGDPVKKDQKLFEIYSPKLINAQQEFILALDSKNKALIEASQKKLLTLGLNDQQIDELKKTRKIKQQVAVFDKTGGILSKLNIRDGMYITPDKELMVIEDLSSIWVRVEVYEKQSDWVKLHQTAIASFPGLPGKEWQGEVIYIYPKLDKMTHTLGVRLQFPNPDLTLKPNMYATVRIFVPEKKKTLTVPTSAVIRTEEGSHVIIALGEGRFKPQVVTTGIESNGKLAILSGLSEGDKVVVSGQFLIDSESSLKAAFRRLDPAKKELTPDRNKIPTTYNRGKILAIVPQKNRIILQHSPIKALGMPEMVMELPVAKTIDLSAYHVGQEIDFQLSEDKPYHYTLTKIRPVKNKNDRSLHD
ncbi:efflux RND transporter periplasmic adaptor subunit [Legionella israelensis]|uniref:Copper/silver efflux system, membrane fusion protein n=1 Tax=Legionella israelensis TaxID=454 RepID=A0A0W0WGI4_9GAMM|nr:efflux RND transporter periplasmic adaptor subunit [Legionella israelensis]KTD31429.1 copper/silver efflux system, membrane fusion protein [Legionella israelensis]QBS09203.1 efflux RND transporter periplasmic adaptor subunit [Legionella israelensis]SCY42197.1 membrane fusion protein, Cu(I)/Ag(I) efflux system [Legionella israelensis DSM 19235]STX58942.1 copper/silver efflux system, membrane fusion protein [Legionella israelensis]